MSEARMRFVTELPAGVRVVDLSTVELSGHNSPLGQLAFRYKHGWILINPAIPSRGKHGGGLAMKHGHKSGGVTSGHFEKHSVNGHDAKVHFVADKHSALSLGVANKLKAKHAAEKKMKAEQEVADKKAKGLAAVEDYKVAQAKAAVASKAAWAMGETPEKHEKAQMAHLHAKLAGQAAQDATGGAYKPGLNYHQAKAVSHKDQKEDLQAIAAENAAAEKAAAAEHETMKAKTAALSLYDQNHQNNDMVSASKLKATVLANPDKFGGLKLSDFDAIDKHHADIKAKKEGAAKKVVAKKPSGWKKTTVHPKVAGDGDPLDPVPGYKSPSGKTVVHKNLDGKGWAVTSPEGIKVVGPFKTKKTAQDASTYVETHGPADLTHAGVQKFKADDPEKYAEFKKGLMAGASTGKFETGTSETKPDVPESKPVEVEKFAPDKNQAVLDAIQSLPNDVYMQHTMAEWKAYFGAAYDKNHDKTAETLDAYIAQQNNIYKDGLDPNSAKYAAMLKANKQIKAAAQGAEPEIKAAEASTNYTMDMIPDSIPLPGPGMYADGNAIKAALNEWKAKEPDMSAAVATAWHEKIMDAKAAFKEKYDKAFSMGSVESATPKGSFVPQIEDTFFKSAKDAGYTVPGPNEDVTHGWQPPAATKGALTMYTGSGYSSINAQLRQYGLSGGSNDNTIKHMDQAFADSPGLDKDTVAIRKMKNAGQFPSYPPPMEPGAEYIDYGYGSTSKSTTAWSGAVRMQIRMPKGTKVVDVNHNHVVGASSSEQEILLDRGAKYRVISDSMTGGQRNIEVEVVSTGHVKGKS